MRRESDADDVGWSGRWVGHADRPPRGEGRRARAGGRRDSFAARCARAPRSIRWRRRRSPRPGRERDASPGTPPRAPRSGAWVGSDSASRHTRARPGVARPSVATAGGVDRVDRRDRRDPFGGRNPVDRASPGYLQRRTAGERVAGRGAPPGEFGNRALRAEKDRFRGSVQSASRASFYRFSRSVSRAKWRERHPLVAPDRSFAKGRGEKVVDTPRSVSIVGGGGTPRRPSPARRTRRRPVRRCRARAAMARLRRVLRSRTTRSRGR